MIKIEKGNYYCRTEAIANKLLKEFEKADIKWGEGQSATNFNIHSIYICNNRFCIYYDEYGLHCGNVKFYNIIDAEEFLNGNTSTPYLKYGCSKLGNIGEISNIKDIKGITLKIGDTANVYYNGEFKNEQVVCCRENNIYFLSEMSTKDFKYGVCINEFNTYTIIKNKDYTEIKNDEEINNIKYIKREEGKK